tara:strand:- start:446 stop:742 length:297 start_codon:yes stop_codon:yes gene_type:complete
MNIEKHLQIEEIVAERHLPSDVYNLTETYFSNSKQKDIDINSMEFIHMVRAFLKTQKTLDKIKSYLKENVNESSLDMSVQKDSDQLLYWIDKWEKTNG